MTRNRERHPDALVLDPDVLRDAPVCEFQSERAVEAKGGSAILPWRARFEAARRAELDVHADATALADASFSQVVVHLQKSRAATFEDLAAAWRVLETGGQLLFSGTNTLGVVSAVKRLAAQLEEPAIVVSNRAKARVVRFIKKAGQAGPEPEATPSIEVALPGLVKAGQDALQEFEIRTAPGVFSAKKLDAGSELLLAHLAKFVGHKPPKRIVDLGCGTGVLGLSAAHLWPEAEVLLADADARAVACASLNAEELGFDERCRVEWWDAREEPLDTRFQLALVNPPFHQQGPEVDLAPALALFDSLGRWLKPGGRALIVANRTLPYEAALERVGEVDVIDGARGYKLLSLTRSARSSGARGRHSPGERSSGRSRSPTRSR